MTAEKLRKLVDINAHGVTWREAVGGALHDAVHPGHPWSGCRYPDRVYDEWMPRFLLSLRAEGLDVMLTPNVRAVREDWAEDPDGRPAS